jgi:hypothetical protein
MTHGGAWDFGKRAGGDLIQDGEWTLADGVALGLMASESA